MPIYNIYAYIYNIDMFESTISLCVAYMPMYNIYAYK